MNDMDGAATVDFLGTAVCEAIGLDPGQVSKLSLLIDPEDRGAATINANLVCTERESKEIASALRGIGHNITLIVDGEDG